MNQAVIKAAFQISKLKRENRELKRTSDLQHDTFMSSLRVVQELMAHNNLLAQANLELADELRARGVPEAISEESADESS